MPLHTDLAGRLYNSFGSYGGHGIRVASLAGALTDNSTVGMASLGWDISSMQGYPNITWTSNSTAADDGADVIQNSWRVFHNSGCSPYLEGLYPGFNAGLEDAVEYALAMGVVVVGSAGNDDTCIPESTYPAAHSFTIGGKLHQVIAVSGTYADDDFVDGFQYSPGSDPISNPTTGFVDVAAPSAETTGTPIGVWTAYSYSDGRPDPHTYAKTSGTSFGGPMVAATAALLLSMDSTLEPPDVYNLITQSAAKVGQYGYDGIGWNQRMGYGRLDAGAATCYLDGACSPSAPSSLTISNPASVGQNPILVWGKSNGPIKHYEIYRAAIIGSSGYSKIGETSSLTFTDPDIAIATSSVYDDKYAYKVLAAGYGSNSSYSNEVNTWGEVSWKAGDSILSDQELIPLTFELLDSYPNPFNPSTTISFTLPKEQLVHLEVFNALGQSVRVLANSSYPLGEHSVYFDATGLPSGSYIYKITAGEYSLTKFMTLMK